MLLLSFVADQVPALLAQGLTFAARSCPYLLQLEASKPRVVWCAAAC